MRGPWLMAGVGVGIGVLAVVACGGAIEQPGSSSGSSSASSGGGASGSSGSSSPPYDPGSVPPSPPDDPPSPPPSPGTPKDCTNVGSGGSSSSGGACTYQEQYSCAGGAEKRAISCDCNAGATMGTCTCTFGTQNAGSSFTMPHDCSVGCAPSVADRAACKIPDEDQGGGSSSGASSTSTSSGG